MTQVAWEKHGTCILDELMDKWCMMRSMEYQYESAKHCKWTFQHHVQNGVLTDLFVGPLFCIHLSIQPMQISILLSSSPIIGQLSLMELYVFLSKKGIRSSDV